MKYIEAEKESRVFDPTVERKWLKIKEAKISVSLKVGKGKIEDQVIPETFRGQLGELKNLAEWGKSLSRLPSFTNKEIEAFVEKVNKSMFGDKVTNVKRNFERGIQLVKENFVDLFRFMVKDDARFVYIKSLVGASLKQEDRWVSASIHKSSGAVEFCHCQYKAGKSGTCSHAYAVLHLLAQ